MPRYLTKSRSTRLSIATINPGITQTGPSLTVTHSLTRHATFFGGIQNKFRAPFDGLTPKLQILNPSATLLFFWTLIFQWRQRFTVGSQDHGKEKVHRGARDCANQEEGEKREPTKIWIVLATTHFPECREIERGGFVFGFSFFLRGHGKRRKREHQQQRRGQDRWRLFHYEAESNRKVMLPPQIKTTLFLINLSLSLFLLFPFPFFVIYALSFVFWLLSLFSPHIACLQSPCKTKLLYNLWQQPTFHPGDDDALLR